VGLQRRGHHHGFNFGISQHLVGVGRTLDGGKQFLDPLQTLGIQVYRE
jgi:hypothetical protein